MVKNRKYLSNFVRQKVYLTFAHPTKPNEQLNEKISSKKGNRSGFHTKQESFRSISFQFEIQQNQKLKDSLKVNSTVFISIALTFRYFRFLYTQQSSSSWSPKLNSSTDQHNKAIKCIKSENL